jgi:hypothetical protein
MLIQRFFKPVSFLRSTYINSFSKPIVSLPRHFSSSSRTLNDMSNEEKSLTLPVLDEAELKDGEMKQVEFGEGENKGKVLLVKVGGKVVSNRSSALERLQHARLTICRAFRIISSPIRESARITEHLW